MDARNHACGRIQHEWRAHLRAANQLESNTSSGTRLLDQSGEGSRVGYRKLAQYLAVYLNRFLGQAVDELRVADAVRSAACADTGYPQPSKVPLLVPAVAKSVLAAFHHLFVGGLEIAFFATPIALGPFQNLLVPLFGHRAALYSRHECTSFFEIDRFPALAAVAVERQEYTKNAHKSELRQRLTEYP